MSEEIKRCSTCLMPLKKMQFGEDIAYGCQNPGCYQPDMIAENGKPFFDEVRKDN